MVHNAPPQPTEGCEVRPVVECQVVFSQQERTHTLGKCGLFQEEDSFGVCWVFWGVVQGSRGSSVVRHLNLEG